MRKLFNSLYAGLDPFEAIIISGVLGVSIGLLIGLPLAIIVYLLRLACS